MQVQATSCETAGGERVRGTASLCAYRKEQRWAEIADMCSFIPSSLEHCNAMRILGVWATSQTHWGGQKRVGVMRRRKREAEAVSKFTYSLILQGTLIRTSGHFLVICLSTTECSGFIRIFHFEGFNSRRTDVHRKPFRFQTPLDVFV